MDWLAPGALIASIVAAVVALLSFLKSKNKDQRSDATTEATILTEIGYIKGNTDEIKNGLRDQREKTTELRERVSAVEESAKSAHKRIDRLEEVHNGQ